MARGAARTGRPMSRTGASRGGSCSPSRCRSGPSRACSRGSRASRGMRSRPWARPVEAVAAQGGGPPVRRPRGGGEASSSSEIIVQALPGRQLALSGDTEAEAPATTSLASPPAPGQGRAQSSRRAPAGACLRPRSGGDGAAATLAAGEPGRGAGAATGRAGPAARRRRGLRGDDAQYLRHGVVSRDPGPDRAGDRGGDQRAVADGSLRRGRAGVAPTGRNEAPAPSPNPIPSGR